jgi:hypothetical protein
MEFSTQTIYRYDINDIIYIANPTPNNDCPVDNKSQQIIKVTFNNGLVFYVGFSDEINYINLIKKEFEMYNPITSVEELQLILSYNYNKTVNYSDCERIFNYYKNNESLIVEVIQSEIYYE